LDNENLYVGMDNDIFRSTASPPQRDRAGYTNEIIFGSNHPTGVNMLYCDGSVHHIGWDVDPRVFARGQPELTGRGDTRAAAVAAGTFVKTDPSGRR
jgi:prepilin-type processing-associated H-X9-DG protein